MSGLFDFNDLSDLPEDLQAKLANGGRVNPNITIYADIVKAGSAAGVAVMSGRMIEAVAVRMGLIKLSDNALRTALNGAVTAKLIRKISRQTYGVILPEGEPVDARDATPELKGDFAEATEAVDPAAVEMPIDPLAG
jgi:hypothetical protein